MASSTSVAPVRAVLKNLLWVPHTTQRERDAKKIFHIELFKDDKCEKCEYASMRPCDVCEGCDNFLGSYKLYRTIETKSGARRIGVPVGDEAAIKKWLGADPILVDRRAAPKFSTRIRFTAKLNDPQIKPVRVMMDEERGILEAPPRAGKTVMATYISCKLGLKTLIITNQYDYLAQFYETICGSEKETAMTDAPEIEKFEGRKIVGYAKHPEDMAKYDICLATYQSFISKRGKKRLKAIRDMFGLVVIDECWTYEHRLTTDQGLLPIGQIVEQRLKVRVLSHNHKTGRDEYRPVESVTKKKTRRLIKIAVNGKEYQCTPNHEWWSETRGKYVAAFDVQLGEDVLTTQGLATVDVTEIVELDDEVDVYDVGVEHNHNYYVAGPDGTDSVLVHNCHRVPADKYLSVIAGLNPKYMVGLTGTPERKDGRHVLTDMVLGPVKARAKVKTLIPRVRIIETPASTSQNYKTWVGGVNYLSRHVGRNKLIARWAVQDVMKNGRSVVIPVERVVHVKELVELINKLAGKQIAAPFTGEMSKKQRDQVREDAKSYKVKVVVGMRKMVQVGINVPRWDTLYEVMPISNPPNLTQETARIRTVVDGKNQPIIRHFVEDFGPTKGCLRTCVWQTYRPSGFIMSKKDESLAKKYMSKQKVQQSKSEGISLW